jgi:hypothetical protein
VYVSAKIVGGAGSIAIGVAEVPSERAPLVAKAVGARNRADDSGRLDAWPGLEARVLERRRRLGSRWEDLRRAALPLDPRAPTKTTFEIGPRRCVDVFTTPSEEVASLVVEAESEEGRTIARAEPEGRDRVMVLCSTSGDTVTLSLRPRGAPGVAAIVLGSSVEGAEAEIASSSRIDRVTATQPLADARRELGALLAKAGYSEPKTLGTGDAKVGSRAGIDLKLTDGCARVDVVAGEPLGAVSAALWDEAGNLVAESRGSARATLFACGSARDARLDVEAEARPGPFAAELRPIAAPPRALIDHPLAASRLLERLYADDTVVPDLSSISAIELAPSKLARLPIALDAGTCLDVATAVDTTGSGLDLRLTSAHGSETITRGRFVTGDRACATDAKIDLTAEIRLTTGEGAALVATRRVSP